MKCKIFKIGFMAIGILFAASCQKDYSESKSIISERNDETSINARQQNIERIILPAEEPSEGLPPFYMSEIKDGMEILKPMQQLPPSVPGGGTCGAMLGVVTPDVYNANLYFEVYEVRELLAPTNVDPIYSGSSTGLGIWEGVNLSTQDFGYLITNNGNKIRLTAKRATANEYNKISCGTYEVFTCTPGYYHDVTGVYTPDEDGNTIYVLRTVYNFTLITYPYTFID
jgi:hypothetical protein